MRAASCSNCMKPGPEAASPRIKGLRLGPRAPQLVQGARCPALASSQHAGSHHAPCQRELRLSNRQRGGRPGRPEGPGHQESWGGGAPGLAAGGLPGPGACPGGRPGRAAGPGPGAERNGRRRGLKGCGGWWPGLAGGVWGVQGPGRAWESGVFDSPGRVARIPRQSARGLPDRVELGDAHGFPRGVELEESPHEHVHGLRRLLRGGGRLHDTIPRAQ